MSTSVDTIIQSMYAAINRRDIDTAISYIDDGCTYQDLNFPQPFQGKEAVRTLLEDTGRDIPNDLLFVIDDITQGDAFAVGVLWHVELDGVPFPNGQGVSFYRLSAQTGKIIFARDVVEPTLKPGKVAFWILRLTAPLVRRWLKPQKVKESTSPQANQSWLALLLGIVAIAYIYILLLSPPGQLVPGEPVWAIRPETVQEILDESINFFFILPLLNAIGLPSMTAPIVHPVTEALFNFAEAWIFMFLPLLLTDLRGNPLPRVLTWGLSMFLTNVFLCPYMALRAAAPNIEVQASPLQPIWARVFGWTGLTVSLIAVFWFGIGRPEFGDLADRVHYFGEKIVSDRVTFAFCIDLILFALFQAILMGAVEPLQSRKRWLRFIPFWGLAVWLIVE